MNGPLCQYAECKNEARYHTVALIGSSQVASATPVYCGVHDIVRNEGKGVLKSELAPESEPKHAEATLLQAVEHWKSAYWECHAQLQTARASIENHVTETAWDKGIIKNLTDNLKDAHDLGKRLLFERNSFEGMYKNEQELRARAATTFDHALSVARLERDTARAAAADRHSDCISGEEVAALRALGPPCGCAACRLFWSKK